MTFGKWLAEKRRGANLTQSQLAKRVGISVTYVSAMERDEPNARDGSPRRPRLAKIDALAKALNVDPDEARLAAGYAPQTRPTKPQTLPEFIDAMKSLGIDPPLMYDRLPDDTDGEAFREAIERMWLDVELVVKRQLAKIDAEREAEIERIAAERRAMIVPLKAA